MTKEELAKAYYDWYRQEQMNRSGCGGPVLMASVVIAIIILISI